MKILTINSGSSSLKFSIFRMQNDLEEIERKGELSNIGLQKGLFRIEDGDGNQIEKKELNIEGHNEALYILFDWLKEDAPEENITAVGHRIVHGGPAFREPVILTDKILEDLEKLLPLAPEHLPHELKAINIITDRFPDLKQTLSFDTGFHHNMPEVSRRYPLPQNFWDEGIRRYGFHGLSYEYILQELVKEAGPQILEDRIIIAHLGNGASMAAVKDGKSFDTTMGFTPAGGLMMSTRTGDLDPGVMIYFMNKKGMDKTELNKLVNEKSGLLGISGDSSSMEELLARQDDDDRLAIEMFCYQARKYLGGLVNALGGLETLVFTAGIGENSPEIRRQICMNSGYLGIHIDEKRNNDNAKIISGEKSRVTVRVMETNEELMIARHTRKLISEKR